jgi:hypothetical protein
VKSQVAASEEDGVIEPVVKKMRGTKAKRARRVSVKKAAPKPVAAAPKKRARKAAAAKAVITPLIKPESSAPPAAPKRRRQKGAATNTPEGGTSAGSGEPTAKSAPAPESGTGAGAAATAPRVGAAAPPGETREPVAPGTELTGDGSGQALPSIAGNGGGTAQEPIQEHAAPAAARETKTLDLFS